MKNYFLKIGAILYTVLIIAPILLLGMWPIMILFAWLPVSILLTWVHYIIPTWSGILILVFGVFWSIGVLPFMGRYFDWFYGHIDKLTLWTEDIWTTA